MADRSEVSRSSAAHLALSEGGQRVLRVIEDEGRRGVSTISLDTLSELSGLCRSSVRRGVRQLEELGFVVISMTPRRVSLFKLSDGWKSLDPNEVKLRLKQAREPTPPRPRTVSPKPSRPVKVKVEVEQPQRYTPSLPQLRWLGRGAFDHRAT